MSTTKHLTHKSTRKGKYLTIERRIAHNVKRRPATDVATLARELGAVAR